MVESPLKEEKPAMSEPCAVLMMLLSAQAA
jgi:hypothetical protein